ncbi:MAG: class I SAM-dependent methyltransferase [Bacteroidetes bacterium QS_8_68_15]|nr:MAG: class I SAM-dependent methyltransferase [Bacteroidetes bacterium QS_8_68_15]
MPWYADWFDRPEYERVYRQRDAEEAERIVGFIERVAAPRAGAHLLDVGCGRGRHARAFARLGYRVTGIDLSERAIATARRRAEDEDLAIDFRRRDMRAPMGTEAFDGGVNLFSSFGYFNTEHEHQQVIDHVAASLRPSGFFVQDFLNAEQVRASLVPESTRFEDGFRITERRWIENDRIEKKITLSSTGDGADADSPQTFRESVRLLERDDFRRFYERAGLRLDDTFGDYDGAPFDEADSPRLIMVSRKVEGEEV